MGIYGITEKGFVLKRMDTILEEVHTEMTEGLGVDTRLSATSFLNVLVTSFCGQMEELWEVAQDSYYAKYPTTAVGINLDNAVQFGGIRRKKSKKSLYQLHCTGDDGTVVRKNTLVATNTKPEVRLYAVEDFTIARESCNAICIQVASAQAGAIYIININGANYSYSSTDADRITILNGLKNAIIHTEYTVMVEKDCLVIQDKDKDRNNVIALTENLTTSNVTSIANFYTEAEGKIVLANGIVSKIVTNNSGFHSVVNQLEPVYGRSKESDVELRQSYIARSALRSNTMIDSIVAELLNNVPGVETASGYENVKDVVDERGLPPHSIELIVEGGSNVSVADAILRKKAGGIQTYGSITVDVATAYGYTIPIHFNRPEYLYTWIKVILHGDISKMPLNYVALVKRSIVEDTELMVAGASLLIQLLNEGIYGDIAGITYVDIYTAYSIDPSYIPKDNEYQQANVIAIMRQKVLVDEARIEVSLYNNI